MFDIGTISSAAFQMFVETAFWFHPLVWWIGKRMVAERERACDEEVLRLGNEPNIYAESILRVCALYVEAPLRCVPGVTGADLKKRVQAIVARRAVADLSPARKAMLTVLGLACLTMPVLIGMLREGQPETACRSCRQRRAGFRVSRSSAAKDICRARLRCRLPEHLLPIVSQL